MASNAQLQKYVKSLTQKVEKLKMEKAALLEIAKRAVADSVQLHREVAQLRQLSTSIRSDASQMFPAATSPTQRMYTSKKSPGVSVQI